MSPARIKAVCLDTASLEVESEVGTNAVLIVCYMYMYSAFAGNLFINNR